MNLDQDQVIMLHVKAEDKHFVHDNSLYSVDSRALVTWNNLFGNAVKVYREESSRSKRLKTVPFEISNETIFVVTVNGNVLRVQVADNLEIDLIGRIPVKKIEEQMSTAERLAKLRSEPNVFDPSNN